MAVLMLTGEQRLDGMPDSAVEMALAHGVGRHRSEL